MKQASPSWFRSAVEWTAGAVVLVFSLRQMWLDPSLGSLAIGSALIAYDLVWLTVLRRVFPVSADGRKRAVEHAEAEIAWFTVLRRGLVPAGGVALCWSGWLFLAAGGLVGPKPERAWLGFGALPLVFGGLYVFAGWCQRSARQSIERLRIQSQDAGTV